MLVLRQWTVYVNEQFTAVGVHVKLFPFTLVGLIQQRPDASVPLYGKINTFVHLLKILL